MLLRSNAGRIYRSDSDDFGKTWSRIYPTNLVHNNSGIDLVRLPDGRLILAHNPILNGRNKLVLSMSCDNGVNWQVLEILEDNPDVSKHYSYPSVILLRNGTIAVSYTFEKQQIAVAYLKL